MHRHYALTKAIWQAGTPIAPTFYLIAAAVASGATILFFRETAFERLR